MKVCFSVTRAEDGRAMEVWKLHGSCMEPEVGPGRRSESCDGNKNHNTQPQQPPQPPRQTGANCNPCATDASRRSRTRKRSILTKASATGVGPWWTCSGRWQRRGAWRRHGASRLGRCCPGILTDADTTAYMSMMDGRAGSVLGSIDMASYSSRSA